MGFYGSPPNPMSLTCGLTAAEATEGKEQGKECADVPLRNSSLFFWTINGSAKCMKMTYGKKRKTVEMQI